MFTLKTAGLLCCAPHPWLIQTRQPDHGDQSESLLKPSP